MIHRVGRMWQKHVKISVTRGNNQVRRALLWGDPSARSLIFTSISRVSSLSAAHNRLRLSPRFYMYPPSRFMPSSPSTVVQTIRHYEELARYLAYILCCKTYLVSRTTIRRTYDTGMFSVVNESTGRTNLSVSILWRRGHGLLPRKGNSLFDCDRATTFGLRSYTLGI